MFEVIERKVAKEIPEWPDQVNFKQKSGHTGRNIEIKWSRFAEPRLHGQNSIKWTSQIRAQSKKGESYQTKKPAKFHSCLTEILDSLRSSLSAMASRMKTSG